MGELRDKIKKYAEKENTSIKEIADALGYGLAELEEKIKKGNFTRQQAEDIQTLLGIDEPLIRNMSKYVSLDDLEDKVLEEMKDAFATQLENYCKDNKFQHPTKELSSALMRSRGTLHPWVYRKSFPGFNNFFEVQAIIMKGHKNVKKKGRKYLDELKVALCQNFMDYFGKTVKKHCADKGIYVSEFAEDLGVHAGTLQGLDSWNPSRSHSYLANPKTYVKVMVAIHGDSKEKIVDPLFSPQDMYEGQYKIVLVSEVSRPDDEAAAEAISNLDEIMRNYQSMSDSGKAYFVKELMSNLGEAVEYFRKGNFNSRELLRKACKNDLDELGIVLMLTKNILRNEKDFQNHIQMNEELYGGR